MKNFNQIIPAKFIEMTGEVFVDIMALVRMIKLIYSEGNICGGVGAGEKGCNHRMCQCEDRSQTRKKKLLQGLLQSKWRTSVGRMN